MIGLISLKTNMRLHDFVILHLNFNPIENSIDYLIDSDDEIDQLNVSKYVENLQYLDEILPRISIPKLSNIQPILFIEIYNPPEAPPEVVQLIESSLIYMQNSEFSKAVKTFQTAKLKFD